ncbi:iron complex transport system ATP-binding protein [Caldalkalibacillus uzonensis]|uniref:Iron complex transport system ATP-binding protein n=1 Tax=Caldalkalibacillus uzonensis TaxID=353224 RepID=A0ABU0CR26_9BACI|nr:adenosylcobinamide amidohydrolase [Caldalkalibacillus uzonensis]MDQ0338341.1 iron complex transport system ATP-binding protein [Caldalkalibacillus uzonensis]
MMELRQVSGGYEAFKVKQINLTLRKGEFFALLGPNGSGKSTLLKLMTGVLSPEQGEICLNGTPLARYGSVQKAKLISVLGQEEHVSFDFTVEEIVALGRYPHQHGLFNWLSAEDERVITEAMEATHVAHYRKQPFRLLSGGEKQRVLLAKALAQEPQLLFLDEPTNHLDLKHTFNLLNMLKEWQRSKALTVFAILHDINVAALYADRLGLMKDGYLQVVNDVHLLKDEDRIEDIYRVRVNAQAHPQLDKPQFMLTPKEEQGQASPSLLAGYRLTQDEKLLYLCFDHPLKVMANSVWGSGISWAAHFCNFHVPKHYNCSNPESDVKRWLEERSIPVQQAIGMMTAVDLEDYVLLEREEAPFQLLAVVTAGTGNAVDISQNHDLQTLRQIGTINTMVFIDGHLTDGAFVNAVMTATEAKAKALATLQVKDKATGTLATGTSTDSVVIAATQRGKKTPYAGSATVLGKALGQLVYQATLQAIQKYWRRLGVTSAERG